MPRKNNQPTTFRRNYTFSIFSLQVIAVTLAFAVCWLPIHILELMRCTNSQFLHTLIRSYPRLLYSFRAFTHALAYFNSCLNPYLYALLNRSFCIDLVDIIPSWRPCCPRVQTLEEEHTYFHRKSPATAASPDQILLSEKDLQDDDGDYKQSSDNISYQAEPPGVQSKDISSQ